MFILFVAGATGSGEGGHGGGEEDAIDEAEPLHRQPEELHGADSRAGGCSCEGKHCLRACMRACVHACMRSDLFKLNHSITPLRFIPGTLDICSGVHSQHIPRLCCWCSDRPPDARCIIIYFVCVLFSPSLSLSSPLLSRSLPLVARIRGHLAGASPPFPPRCVPYRGKNPAF